ncbi:ABC transporter substrate-binding protein [Halomonas binhaiensis]|nr:ABC transporter substrate-binding protein [Halomonas binhaiensis]
MTALRISLAATVLLVIGLASMWLVVERPKGSVPPPSKLVIAAALDEAVVAPLLEAFGRAYPHIQFEYRDRSSLEVDRSVTEGNPPDVVISSAMPWQMAQVNAGLARHLDSEETRNWPEWAKWRDEVFGFTFEPIVMAYHLELSRHVLPPETHADLLELLDSRQNLLRGRVVTYSPFNSGIGYTLFQQDARYSSRFWDLVTSMGRVETEALENTLRMLEGIDSGRYWLGYNLLGSYALVYAQEHPNVIVQIPTDYSLVMMRMVFVHRDAPHPAAATTFVNFLLSEEGQGVLAGQTPMFSIRPGIKGPYTAARLLGQVGDRLYPIPINASLLAFVDPARREAFIEHWRQAFSGDREAVDERHERESGALIPR